MFSMISNNTTLKPLVSAVITTHNRFVLLLKAIDSVKNQTYKNIEIVVVDDASTDCSYSELNNRNDISYIRIVESHGGNHARNVGIKAANGSYIAFLDDDDEWLPTKIEKQVNLLISSTGCYVVGCKRLFEFNFDRTFIEKKNLPTGDLSKIILTCIPYTTSSLLISKDLLLRVGLFDEHLTHWQEYELQLRLYQYTKVLCVQEPLVLYRVVSTDNQRLSNNLNKWELAVAYIESKHSTLIARAPLYYRRRHRQLIDLDGAKRSLATSNRIACRKYLFDSFLAVPSFKGVVKFILCLPSFNSI